jgi:two-component sensor histidine kinase
MIGKWYNSLRVQIVLLLTVALLPVGGVAIYQTNSVAKEADHNGELALLALTERAAKAEELTIERALGVTQFFATVASDFVEKPERCTEELADFIAAKSEYSFIGILPESGLMTCSSSGENFDFSDWPGFQEDMANQERTIVVAQDAPLSGKSVFVVSEPFTIDGEFAGFVSLSIPHSGLPDTSDALVSLGLQELITYNAEGELLTARSDFETAATELPADRALKILTAEHGVAFQAENMNGVLRTYTVVPIEGSPAAVIAVWQNKNGVASRVSTFIRPSMFPILMWFASMAVAMLAIYTLVLRHITRLRSDMDNFATDRTISPPAKAIQMPNEFRYLNDNFIKMTDDLMQDEAKLEDALREKNVLIKEVHHRVKNNLQLISSIMNMKIRTAKHEETKSVLARLQERVLSLAMIHRDLYQSQNGGMVDVGRLVSEVVQNTFEVAISSHTAADLQTDIDRVMLFPDQAVPLSLLVAEGMTNAMKYLGRSGTQKPWINVSLKQDGLQCVLTLSNAVGGTSDAESTGLGAQLINAFGIQLGAKIEIEEATDSYKMKVMFTAAEFEPETPDF